MDRAERLQKIISQWGIASRRQAEQLIVSGQVRLNGAVASLGDKADPSCDRIEVNGKLIQSTNRPHLVYLLLHKPVGVVSTCHDPQGRSTVLDLLPARYHPGLHPVGRLDSDSTGALLLTNDGHLTYGLTHPRHHIAKTYQVWVEGRPSPAALRQWQTGVMLEGQLTLPAQVRVLQQTSTQTCLEIILHEGRNRQIRKVSQQLGYPVVSLHRTAIGPLNLRSIEGKLLSNGQYRPLTQPELDLLHQLIDLSSKGETAQADA
jgi:23S rRNA pseudouridine2605 synthase